MRSGKTRDIDPPTNSKKKPAKREQGLHEKREQQSHPAAVRPVSGCRRRGANTSLF